MSKPGARPKHELSVILEAARLFPDNVQAAAEYVGCTYTTIDRYMMNAGLPIIPRRTKSPVAGYRKIDWNAASVAKLQALIDKRPRPSIDEIATKMQCKKPALYGIMSNWGCRSAIPLSKPASACAVSGCSGRKGSRIGCATSAATAAAKSTQPSFRLEQHDDDDQAHHRGG